MTRRGWRERSDCEYGLLFEDVGDGVVYKQESESVALKYAAQYQGTLLRRRKGAQDWQAIDADGA